MCKVLDEVFQQFSFVTLNWTQLLRGYDCTNQKEWKIDSELKPIFTLACYLPHIHYTFSTSMYV